MQNTKLLSQKELIKQEIKRIHDRNRGSAEVHRLISQVKDNFQPIIFNPLQMIMAILIRSGMKEINVEAGRGAGKSTGIGNQIREIVTNMPRSNNLLIGATYQQILTRTLPSTILALENLGIFKDLHYFIGRRPPKSWKWAEPYQPPNKFDRFVWFWTGAGYNLISQDVTGDGRGLNSDSQIKDEAGLLDWEKLDANTNPTQRGSNFEELKNKRTFLSDLSCSTTPLTLKGKWFIDRDELADQQPDQIKFLKATCEVNKKNLPPDYMDKARKGNISWIFDAEYRNIRPRQVKEGFYPLLDEQQHTYTSFNYNFYQNIGQTSDCRGDGDLSPNHPLILSVDWGAVINSLTVNQHIGRIYRTLKSMFVLSDDKQIQDDLFKEFHEYYQYHQTKNKVIYMWYDNSGNNETGNTKYTRAVQAKRQLEALGWVVHLMTIGGRNPFHELKHILWNLILKGDHPHLPIYQMNKHNCKELWISMFNAQVKQGRNGEIKKDKGSESSSTILRQHATDLSDANDQAPFGMFKQYLNDIGNYLPGIITTSR